MLAFTKKAGAYLLLLSLIVLMAVGFTTGSYFIKPEKVLASESYSGGNHYTVKSGDSLYLISLRYGTTVNALKQANGLKSNTIYPGQSLIIPGSNSNEYTVRSGDSLYFIARDYGISVDDLKQANGLSSNMILPGQRLIIPQVSKSLRNIMIAKGISLSNPKLSIVVDKSDHVLSVYSNGIWLKSYHIELGDGGLGDKQVSGDHKTPEGNLYITQKLTMSPSDPYLGTRWMRLSYPNIEDANRGLNQHLIDPKTRDAIVSAINNKQTPPQYTALGGGIGIHGGSTPQLGKDWTWGCVGLKNSDVEDFYNYTVIGTPVTIQK